MSASWFLKRLIEKCGSVLRYIKLVVVYRPEGIVNILGKVYLDNPNIEFGRNVTLYPNVHIFGFGKVTLEDNVSIGDGTIICAAQDIVIRKNTMVAAQCYIVDCNHGMHLKGGGYARTTSLSSFSTNWRECMAWLRVQDFGRSRNI